MQLKMKVQKDRCLVFHIMYSLSTKYDHLNQSDIELFISIFIILNLWKIHFPDDYVFFNHAA